MKHLNKIVTITMIILQVILIGIQITSVFFPFIFDLKMPWYVLCIPIMLWIIYAFTITIMAVRILFKGYYHGE